MHEQTQGKTEVVASVPEPRGKPGDDDSPPADKHQRKEGDSEAVAQWRARMADDEVKQQYKQRAATAECVNALARNRGLQRMPVRGLSKVRAVAYLYALAHNLMRMAKIAPQLIGWGTGAPACGRNGGLNGVRHATTSPEDPRTALADPEKALDRPNAAANRRQLHLIARRPPCLRRSNASQALRGCRRKQNSRVML